MRSQVPSITLNGRWVADEMLILTNSINLKPEWMTLLLNHCCLDFNSQEPCMPLSVHMRASLQSLTCGFCCYCLQPRHMAACLAFFPLDGTVFRCSRMTRTAYPRPLSYRKSEFVRILACQNEKVASTPFYTRIPYSEKHIKSEPQYPT